MQHSNQALYDSLNKHLHEIEKQIEYITKQVHKYVPVNEKPKDDMVYEFRETNGKPVLADMFVAKATVLGAMANLRLEATMNRTGPPRAKNPRGTWG